MSEKLQHMIHNLATGEVSYVDLTDEEQAAHELNAQNALAQQQSQEAAEQKARDEAAAMPDRVQAMETEINTLKEMVKQLTKR